MPLTSFSEPVREWFSSAFDEPTPAQAKGWASISEGHHTLIAAPTGSGKTLAAFLWGIDQLMTQPSEGTQLLYLSPLRALANDIEKNLTAPLAGIAAEAERLGVFVRTLSVGLRTGDTSQAERRRLVAKPPDILITTPESLYLMLTSKARETLRAVRWVIVDEIHSVAASKRGTHLAVSMERLGALVRAPTSEGDEGSASGGANEPQRIGLSATQRPLNEVAEFLGGFEPGAARPVNIVDAGAKKHLDTEVIIPDQDLGEMGGVSSDVAAGANSIWPKIHPRIYELILEHRSTIVFVNARLTAERLASRLNELHAQGVNRGAEAAAAGSSAAPAADLVRAHHGSISQAQRKSIEDQLKAGQLRAIVSTSSLELGIDMGAVDLVIQVASPGSVSSGIQRIGRAGHQVGASSVGKIFPTHRSDLLEACVINKRMRGAEIERTSYVRLALDVLAQQVVAMVATDDWQADELRAVLRSSAPYRQLSQAAFESVLDLLSGRYPSAEFSELRARIVWDRSSGALRARRGAKQLAIINAGTISDRGQFLVFTLDGSRVGELDEEMVFESRPGETFLLGASSWRIEEITHDRVLVTHAPGVPAKMPFWRGSSLGRSLELGRSVGEFVRGFVERLPADLSAEPGTGGALAELMDELQGDFGLNHSAAANVVSFLDAQRAATGAVPDDRTIVVEHFLDELGDWRICVLTPFGAQVHMPWSIGLRAALEARLGSAVDLLYNDDGIILRLADSTSEVDITAEVALDPDSIAELLVSYLPSTALFASVFREVAGRALLLPRRRPGERTPLWQQRQRAAGLLEVAAKYPDFPMLVETTRECLQDVFDVPALVEVLRDIASGRTRIVSVRTNGASPMAQGLLFDWTEVFLYAGDLPLAERRAAALSLNQDLLAELLGPEELRSLIDPAVLVQLETELAAARARDADQLHDEIRRLGGVSREELLEALELGAKLAGDRAATDDDDQTDRGVAQGGMAEMLVELLAAQQVCEVEVAGQARLVSTLDAARFGFGLGCRLPDGLPTALAAEPEAGDHLSELVARFAAARGPFLVGQAAQRLGCGEERARGALEGLLTEGRIRRGEFRPGAGHEQERGGARASESGGQQHSDDARGGQELEWCDPDVLRTLRRRSLAKLRAQIEPAPAASYAKFLLTWHGVDRPRAGRAALADAISLLEGVPLVASTLESEVLAARVRDFRPAELDELFASGELVWVGAGGLGGGGDGAGVRDGRIRLYWRESFGLLAPAPTELPEPPNETLPPAAAAAGSGATAGPAVTEVVRALLASRGSAFWPELAAAAADATGSFEAGPVLDALWELVWVGEVTNDSMVPLRALLAGQGAGRGAGWAGIDVAGRLNKDDQVRARLRQGRSQMRRSMRSLGESARSGPPAAAGRWSLTGPLYAPSPALRPTPTERAHHLALSLLTRHGVLTRAAVLAEQQAGGFAGVYGLLRTLEERGEIRRGYFIDELGGAQFALGEAVDLLRSFAQSKGDETNRVGGAGAGAGGRSPAAEVGAVVLTSTDPAQPYGATLGWPSSGGRPGRRAGSLVVLVDGVPAVQLDRSGRSLVTFGGAVRDARWVEALRQRLADGRLARLELSKIDGQPAAGHELAEWLRQQGFAESYRGLSLRP